MAVVLGIVIVLGLIIIAALVVTRRSRQIEETGTGAPQVAGVTDADAGFTYFDIHAKGASARKNNGLAWRTKNEPVLNLQQTKEALAKAQPPPAGASTGVPNRVKQVMQAPPPPATVAVETFGFGDLVFGDDEAEEV